MPCRPANRSARISCSISTSPRRIARAAGPLEDATVVEIGPGPGGLTRALLALGAPASSRSSATSAPCRRSSEISKRYPGRLEIVCADAQAFDPRPLLGGNEGEDRRQPALQHRHRAPDRLAVDRAMAALVRHDGADVPARGGRAHRRTRKRRGLWTAGSARQLAHRDQDPVRYLPRGLRAAAQGHLVGGAAGAARAHRSRATAGRWSRWRRPRSASAAKCCGKASNRSASTRPGWPRRRRSIRPARRDHSGHGLCCHGARIDRYTERENRPCPEERNAMALMRRQSLVKFDAPLCETIVETPKPQAGKSWSGSSAAGCAIPTCISRTATPISAAARGSTPPAA